MHKTSFKIQAIRLQNVRPFIFEQLELSKVQPTLDPKNAHQLEDYLIGKIDKVLESVDVANKLNELKLPLVRIRIENTGYPVVKSKRLVDHFSNW